MKSMLVATDFSMRSDRALRRATLLARQFSAKLVLLHVVDDDQPRRLLEAERQEATALLQELARTVREADGVACDGRVALGDPFQGIVGASEEIDADVIILGPHRRRALRDVLVGTTVERTIRLSRRPVIMANALPVGAYDRILVATDLSDCSALAIEAARRLGLLDSADVVALHAFDAPAQGMMLRASTTTQQLKNYLADQEEHAGAELEAFLNRLAFKPRERIVRLIETSAAETIRECVRQGRVDLVVLGTRGRSGMARLFLGSVAEDVLRNAEIDVLAVPPGRGAAASPSP